jgi:hypothetical protein
MLLQVGHPFRCRQCAELCTIVIDTPHDSTLAAAVRVRSG